MTFTSPRERQLWTAAGGYFAAILASAYFVRFGVDALRRHGWLTATFWTLAAAIGIGLLLAALRARPGWRRLVVLLATGGAYVVAFHQLRQIEERLHLFEYGLLALLVEGALREREPARPLRAAALAAALTAAAGWLDGSCGRDFSPIATTTCATSASTPGRRFSPSPPSPPGVVGQAVAASTAAARCVHGRLALASAPYGLEVVR